MALPGYLGWLDWGPGPVERAGSARQRTPPDRHARVDLDEPRDQAQPLERRVIGLQREFSARRQHELARRWSGGVNHVRSVVGIADLQREGRAVRQGKPHLVAEPQ